MHHCIRHIYTRLWCAATSSLVPKACFPWTEILGSEAALNQGWEVPCRGSMFFTQHYHLVDTGCSPAPALAAASPRDDLPSSSADVFTNGKLPCLGLDHTYLFGVPHHCSHTSEEPQKDTLKIQAWDKSNLPKLFSLSLTLPVIFQLFLNAFYFIRTLSISELWKIPSYPSRLFAL